jgi:hypothetical protein
MNFFPSNREFLNGIALSPYTGYTRQHWLEITEKLLAGVLPYFNASTGLFDLSGAPGDTELFTKLNGTKADFQREAFERIMMLAVVYTAATDKDAVPGYSGSISAPFRSGYIRGTDPQDPAYWGKRDKNSSLGSVIAMGALLSPKYFWDPLTAVQKRNLLLSFKDLSYNQSFDNNHYFFHMIPVPLLERNGLESNRQDLTEKFQRLLNWHRGDGWYLDGGNRGIDHYNLWGFHLYSQAVCYLDEDWKKQFGSQVSEITARFLKSYPYLYGRDGGPIPWGRSLAYRFAGNGAIGWAVLNGSSPLPPGQARRIASGCLKYFWDHGCMSTNGLMDVGFRGANAVVGETYIDRGTPYFAAQGLVCLLIPPEHPFWTDPELAMPADGSGGAIALPWQGMVLRVRASDGEARMYPVSQPFGHMGTWQRNIKYAQLAYSSSLGWCALGEGGPDLGAGRNGVSLDGVKWSLRDRPRALEVETNQMTSACEIDPVAVNGEFGEVMTHTIITRSGEIHVFWHNCARPLYLYLGGYGISVPPGQEMRRDASEKRILINGGSNYSVMEILQAPPGEIKADLLEPRPGWLHAHLFGGKGAFPYWRSSGPIQPNNPVVIYVDGSRDHPPVVPKLTLKTGAGRLRIEVDGFESEVKIPY